jgi:hypothetical protein
MTAGREATNLASKAVTLLGQPTDLEEGTFRCLDIAGESQGKLLDAKDWVNFWRRLPSR